jgi:hypothetical protein
VKTAVEASVEIPRDTARVQQGGGTKFTRRARTRQGKERLLTLDALDQRTAAAAAARQLIADLSADLGSDLTAGEQQLVQRVALVGAIVADFEARWVAGEQVALSDYLAACNVQRRLIATLGALERVARPVNAVRPHQASPLRTDLASSDVEPPS